MPSKMFSYPLTIKEMYLDTFGHVNNAAYLTILEEARWELLTQNHFGMREIQKTGLGPTLLEIRIRFLMELHLRDDVVIETQLLSYEGKIGTLSQKILRDNEVCCEAEIVFALFSLKERKIIAPTSEWLRVIGAENA